MSKHTVSMASIFDFPILTFLGPAPLQCSPPYGLQHSSCAHGRLLDSKVNHCQSHKFNAKLITIRCSSCISACTWRPKRLQDKSCPNSPAARRRLSARACSLILTSTKSYPPEYVAKYSRFLKKKNIDFTFRAHYNRVGVSKRTLQRRHTWTATLARTYLPTLKPIC